MKRILINDIEHLKTVFKDIVKDKDYTEQVEGFIMLNSSLRSSKTFFVYPDGISIFHSIDGETEEFDTVEELLEGMNNIKEAIEKKAFFLEVEEC